MENNPGKPIHFGICNIKSAFRLIPLKRQCWVLLIMKAKNEKGEWKYFVDKYLPFGASISCVIFQMFSNALAHILRYENRNRRFGLSNYLDDFLHFAMTHWLCDQLILSFQNLCARLAIPLAIEKTVWASTKIVFLGILLDGQHHMLVVPIDKSKKVLQLLEYFSQQKKATVKQIQQLAGLLNFLTHAIYPGRVFTRRMYAKTGEKAKGLKVHHHVSIDKEFKADCKVWQGFLDVNKSDNLSCCRPFIDLIGSTSATDIGFYTDSSANPELGFGGILGAIDWFYGKWEEGYVDKHKPSIEYLELYAVTVGLWIWSEQFWDKRIVIHCDNMAVVGMINKTSSSCQHCMCLLRKVVKRSMMYNYHVYATYVKSKSNDLADSLSQLQFRRFWALCGSDRSPKPAVLPDELWPASHLWNKTY